MNAPADRDELLLALQHAERRLAAVAGLGGPQMGTFEFELRDDGELVFAGADAVAGQLVTVAQPRFFGKPLLQVFTGMAGTDLPDALRATAEHGRPVEMRSYVPPGTRLGRAFSLFAFQSAPRRAVMKFWVSAEAPLVGEIVRRNEALLARIFEQSPVAIALLERDRFTVVDANAECSRLTGRPREDMLGRTLDELGLRPAQGPGPAPGMELPVHDLALRCSGPDGRVQHLALHASAVPVAGGERVLAYLVDMTARAEAQAVLTRLNAELEQRVHERTAELALARDAAERANRTKSDFIAGMSHELRTPLNVILGFAQLMLADTVEPLAPRHRSQLRQVQRAGTHLLDLINEVLDLARLEAGQLRLSLEAVDFVPLLEECLTLMRPIAEEHGIDLMRTPPQACAGHVRADRTRLKQVLLNLLSNAIKYNREQGRVWVACEADGDAVRIGVSDDGPGLSIEQQQRLFRDFERLDADRSAIEGTGIGLALSRRLMTMMGGEIGVVSTPGGGSTFWLRLQRTPAVTPPTPPTPPDPPAVGAPATAAATHTVLYVEDNPVNVLLMEAMLAHRPALRVVSAGLPTLGLEMARSAPPDLVLLDIQLPGMDGYEFLRRLRRSAATRDVPVVAVSANAMPADIARGLAAGFVRYLTKPLDLQQVLQAVDELLGG